VPWLQPCLLAFGIHTGSPAPSGIRERVSLRLPCRQPSPSPGRITGFAMCCRRLGSESGEFRTGTFGNTRALLLPGGGGAAVTPCVNVPTPETNGTWERQAVV